jgi:beta-phosphoglucomutase
MRWVYGFDLFLFDFDGLLVNTEEIHYLAYKRMCANRGYDLDWNFNRYCQIAHYSVEGLRDQIYARFPKLRKIEPSWDVLYAEKKQAIFDLLNEGAVYLMPGVEKLLKVLEETKIPRCVVTHSSDSLVSVIRKQNPILNTIPNWFTREHYTQPKPHPECYQKAIEKLAKPKDKVIGFEDTPRGLRALLATTAKAVLISQMEYPEIPSFLLSGALYYPTFDSIPDDEF